MSWNTVSIGDICDVKGGKRLPKGHDYSPTPTPYRYIRVADINDGKIDVASLNYLYPETQEKIRNYVVNNGDVIISIAGTIGVTVPVTNGMDGINLTENAAKLVPKEKGVYDPYYLSLALQSPHVQNQMSGLTGQVTIGKLALFKIKKIQISLPPLAEQQRIAAILDKADALRAKRRTALAKLDTLLQATFLDMFGDPVTNPKGWETMTLKSVCKKITDGTHDTPARIEAGVKFITGKHIRPFEIDYDNSDYVSPADHQEIYRRCNPEMGDVLYTNIGVNLGTAAMNLVSYEFSMKNVALLKPERKIIDSRYLEHLLNSQNMKQKIVWLASQGGAQSFLSLAAIKQLKILVPTISLQKAFSKKAQQIFAFKKRLSDQQSNLDNLFHSLQQRAFKGEL